MKPKHPRQARNAGKTFKRLIRYIMKIHGKTFIFVFLCIILSSLASISISISLKVMIDNYIEPMVHQASPVFTPFYKALLLLASVFLLGVLANFAYTRLMVAIGQDILKHLRDDMFSHMQSLPIVYFDQNPTGSVMSLYTNDTDAMRQMISQSIPQLFMSVIMIVSTFTAMVVLSPLLSVLAVFMVGILLIATRTIGSNSGKYFLKQQINIAEMTGFIEERMNGQRVVKVFNYEEKTKREFDEKNARLAESSTNANTYANMMGPVIGNIGYILFVSTAVIGGFLAMKGIGGITIGVIASYIQFTKSFTQPFMQVGQQFNSIVMALAGAERIFDLMDETPETDEGYVELVNAVKKEDGSIEESEERTGLWAWKHPHKETGSVSYTELRGDVDFLDMTFGYRKDHPVLYNITLDADAGKKLAFVGSTGAGKTTITNLINRFYDVADGKIRYDGININKIKKADLRHSLGMVLQDTHLFTGSVMENIRYGKLDATDEEVKEAARLAYADQFITRLPEGYDTILTGDGEGLSQGQRQLLAIARAAVANPPVLILDEATSSIDTRTEEIVQRGMDNLMKGRTVFVIAHRLSTIKNSDLILVLEHGRIIERGSHKELIRKMGTYYQLYTGALELD